MQAAIWKLAEERGLPILGICYGFQEMAHALGGKVEKAAHREFGHAHVSQTPLPAGAEGGGAGDLLAGLPSPFQVWMSHGDKITAMPPGFVPVGGTPDCEFAAAASVGRPNRLFGLQFHPEVDHTPQGKDVLRNFVVGVCGAKQDWSMASFMEGACGERGARRSRHCSLFSLPPSH